MKKRRLDDIMFGDRGLLAAVLLNAIQDVRKNNGHAESAKIWFQRESPNDPFSFEWICSELDLDAGAVRRTIGKR